MLDKAYEIFDKTKDIKYGWFDNKGNPHEHISEGLSKNFRFQSPEELEKSRVGICWELVELNRKYLNDADIKCNTYFFVIPYGNFYCHSVLVFKDKDKYYWFESSFKELIGIREYNSLERLFSDVLKNFNKITNLEEPKLEDIKIYDYTTPNFGIGCVLFYFHCFRGKNVTDKYLKNCLKLIEDNN